jgi:hypothetical protein
MSDKRKKRGIIFEYWRRLLRGVNLYRILALENRELSCLQNLRLLNTMLSQKSEGSSRLA